MRYGIVIIVFIFFAIVGTLALTNRGGNTANTAKSARITKLADYESSNSASVSWTMRGRLVGEDQRKAVRITVTRDKRTAEVLSGYEERVEKSVEFINNPEAFATFTRALDNAGFGRERTVSQADDRGMCPLGNTYIYRLTEFGSEIMRTWSDSCTKKDGSFGGGATASLIQQLFKAQITDYPKFVQNVRL